VFDEAVKIFPLERVLTMPILGINRSRAELILNSDPYLDGIK
jgi:hypothetical protein